MPAPKTARASTLIPYLLESVQFSDARRKADALLYVRAGAFRAEAAQGKSIESTRLPQFSAGRNRRQHKSFLLIGHRHAHLG